jgi:hypothetical protein
MKYLCMVFFDEMSEMLFTRSVVGSAVFQDRSRRGSIKAPRNASGFCRDSPSWKSLASKMWLDYAIARQAFND